MLNGRGDKIRTCDPIVPNDVRYQTALHLVVKKPRKLSGLWLWNRDSNPNKQSQSLSCYRYTIPQYQTPKQILSHLRVNIIHTLLRSVNLFSKKFACGLSFLFKPRAADAGAGYPGNYFMQILIFQPRCAIISWQCRCSSMAECQLPKLNTGVRFPSPAPSKALLRKCFFNKTEEFS